MFYSLFSPPSFFKVGGNKNEWINREMGCRQQARGEGKGGWPGGIRSMNFWLLSIFPFFDFLFFDFHPAVHFRSASTYLDFYLLLIVS